MYGFNGNYLWAIIILILIVLQWFRVGYPGGGIGGPGGPIGPELGLMANGGLFIIALFILIACSCFKGIMPVPTPYGRPGYGTMGGYGY